MLTNLFLMNLPSPPAASESAAGAARKPRIIRPFLQPNMGGFVKLIKRKSTNGYPNQ